jgi:hypothetical protein
MRFGVISAITSTTSILVISESSPVAFCRTAAIFPESKVASFSYFTVSVRTIRYLSLASEKGWLDSRIV